MLSFTVALSLAAGLTAARRDVRGRLREIRASLFYGSYRLSCCWAPIVLLIAFGVLNVTAMVILVSIFLVAQCFTQRVAFSRMTGMTALGFPVAVV